MKLCHADEHIICLQYDTDGATIEFIEMIDGEKFQVLSNSNQIVFVHSGSLTVSYDDVLDQEMKIGESILIPMQRSGVFTALKDASILVMKLHFDAIAFCDHFPLELLLNKYEKNKVEKAGSLVLKSNRRVRNFCSTLKDYVNDGVKCTYFYDLKIREFLYLIRVYYDKHLVFNFFKSIYSDDFVFSNNVYKNLDKIKTVKELADALNYSVSGFEKRFKKVFKISPYQWTQQQKAKKIYHEINCSKRTFSEISFDYGFSSPAHFNDFCKMYFHNTPGKLRKGNEARSIVLFK